MRFVIRVLALTALALGVGVAQDNSAPAQNSGTAQTPVPAFGTDNTVPPASENPPISGLDIPNLEPHAAPLSYLQLGAHFAESADSNEQNTLGGSGLGTVTNALGSVDLERLWSHYDLGLDYLGGVGYYSFGNIGLEQIEELGVDQKIMWKRGQLSLRDAFSYQPEGTFGSAYGSVASLGAGLSESNAFITGLGLGALGEVPRITNISAADVVENLTPKSTITATVGYGFVHFLDNEPGFANSFIGNSQITAMIGYDRVLGPHDQGALVYAYQGFSFSTGITFHSNIIQLMWGHRISGRMDFLVAAGPQFTNLLNVPTYEPNTAGASIVPPCVPAPTLTDFAGEDCPTNDLRISAAGRAELHYRFPKTMLYATYDHYITSGAGFFAGSESDIARLGLSRPLSRQWTGFGDLGFSRNSRVIPNSCGSPILAAAACPGVNANVYDYGFAGVGIRRNLGRDFKVFASYQFNYLSFDNSFCAATGECDRISQRHVGTIGIDWNPRPMRID
jgi:hypothetical protein